MNGVQEAIPYEEVSAHQANAGVSGYALPSGGTATGGFVVVWNLESGFTNGGWDKTSGDSPAYGYKEEDIQEEIERNQNHNDMFKKWAEKVKFEDRLNWVTDWMNENPGCVIEDNV